IVTNNEQMRARAIVALEPYLRPDRQRQVNLQVGAALGFIGTDQAVDVLVMRLNTFGKDLQRKRDAMEICQKIVSTLIAVESDRALDAAFELCDEHELL